MTYTPLQLEIIRIFGKKEWKDGCLFISQEDYHCGDSLYEKSEVYEQSYFREPHPEKYEILGHEPHPEKYEILGHIPHLEDVFRLANENKFTLNLTRREWEELYSIHIYGRVGVHNGFVAYINPTLPLLDQDEDALNQLISLFK